MKRKFLMSLQQWLRTEKKQQEAKLQRHHVWLAVKPEDVFM
jgi:hypothetical protein